MPATLTFPGVYIQEEPSGLSPITGVSTATALFIGTAARGLMFEPTLCLSQKDFDRTFGDDAPNGEMSDQVRQFFLNGGREAYIVRIGNGGGQAEVTINDETGTPTLIIQAREIGSVGETLRIEIDYDTGDPETTFNLTVSEFQIGPLGRPTYKQRERHLNLSMDPSSPYYVKDWLDRHSNLIQLTQASPAPAKNKGFSIAGRLTGADPTAVIKSVIPAGGVGQFEISVGKSAFVPVTLDSTLASLNAAAIQTAINTATAVVGATPVSVSMVAIGAPVNMSLLQIADAVVGGGNDIRVRAARTNDIASKLQMGTMNGGFEVGAYAIARPAPTGLVSQIAVLDPAKIPGSAFIKFLALDLQTLGTMKMVDSSGTSQTAAVSAVAKPVLDTALPEPGLREATKAFDQLVATLTDPANSTVPWQAKRTGFRISLTPKFGTDDSDFNAKLSTTGATDLSAANQIFGPGTGAGSLKGPANVRRYRLGGYGGGVGPYANGSGPGTPPSTPQLKDYDTAYDAVRSKVEIFNLLVLPKCDGQLDATRSTLWSPASAFCQQQLAFLFVDPADTWTSIPAVVTGVDGVRAAGVINDHAGAFWPRIDITDPQTGTARTVNPSGALAGLAARIDASRGVWKAFAGLEANLLGVRAVDTLMSDDENGVINPKAANAIRVFPAGTVCWGARTLDGYDGSPNSDYRYIPVRRLALYIEASLARGLRFALFRPNGERLWSEIRMAAGGFMQNLFRQGAFAGATAQTAYQVRCDAETTTEDDRRLGVVNVLVLFAPLFPAEFVVLTIRQMTQESQS